MKKEQFIFNQKILAELKFDEYNEPYISYSNSANLQLGAIQLLMEWELNIINKYKSMYKPHV